MIDDMAQDPNSNRSAGIAPAAPKSPLERAQQIQEMQRQAQTQPVQQATTSPPPAVKEAVVADKVRTKEVFEVNKVEPTNIINGPSSSGLDQAIYGTKQVDDRALFGLGGDKAWEVEGNPWKIIPFGDPPEHRLAPVLDLKQPIGDYQFEVPNKALKLKQGHLFEVGVKAKPGGTEAPKRQAVIVDDQGVIKGVEVKSKKGLESALQGIPSLVLGLFTSAFGDGLTQDDPERMKVLSVDVGKKSAFEAVLEYKSPLDGKKREKRVTLNNYVMRVPESNDRQRHDIITRMYRLDSFEAAPPKQG
jgi:hypothetical protein